MLPLLAAHSMPLLLALPLPLPHTQHCCQLLLLLLLLYPPRPPVRAFSQPTAHVAAALLPTRLDPHESDCSQPSPFGPIRRALLTSPASSAHAQPCPRWYREPRVAPIDPRQHCRPFFSFLFALVGGRRGCIPHRRRRRRGGLQSSLKSASHQGQVALAGPDPQTHPDTWNTANAIPAVGPWGGGCTTIACRSRARGFPLHCKWHPTVRAVDHQTLQERAKHDGGTDPSDSNDSVCAIKTSVSYR